MRLTRVKALNWGGSHSPLIAGRVRVVALAARESVEPLGGIVTGRTIALIGSSGVGKSTIANKLLGESRQTASAVRDTDSRGRHTTAAAILLPMPRGGAIIDSPGIRELQLWATEEKLDDTFAEILFFAQRCRFADCQHTGEPGYAVRDAIESGEIEVSRWRSYRKLRAELRHQFIQQDAHALKMERKRWKAIEKALRKHPKGGI
ncbi:MAG TPA: ribosome small subunit-dependent GTPase A [Bryobacteraceae bacterium]|nr:ribosome small subunit-dependent GTPase A [Bryobacteraceae bacterium]